MPRPTWGPAALLVLAGLTAGCSGPAVCGPFDDGCRQAARVLEEGDGFEPIAVRDVACHPEWDRSRFDAWSS